jgi:DNA recombination-mediator protein A
VLGTGIDIGYPKENKKLDEKVLEPGAIISELPIGAHPAPENFPCQKPHYRRHAIGSGHRGGQAVQRLADHRWNLEAKSSAYPAT